MPDEPTLGEVMRRLEDVRLDLKEDFRELGVRLESKVSTERYSLENRARDEREQGLLERVKALEEAAVQAARDKAREQQEKAAQRASDRRLIFSALIVPVLLTLLTVYLQTKAAAS